jgi:hypothetical protein
MTGDAIQAALDEIASLLPTAIWGPVEGKNAEGIDLYSGTAKGWSFTVARYAKSEPFGFGYDGAAVKAGVILRLTKPLAEIAFKFANR